MKKLFTVLLVFVLAFALVGCGEMGQASYSNLGGRESVDQLREDFEQAGINEDSASRVLKWVDEFNAIVRDYKLADDFVSLPEEGVGYERVLLDDKAKSYSYLQWLNCRLTAFNLLKDDIDTGGQCNDIDTWLMFDIEAIDTVPQLKLSKEDRADFITLFNSISVADSKSAGEDQEIVSKTLVDRGFELDSDKASLACVYLHDPMDKVRFVGHTGVVIEGEEGLVFFEKYSDIAPYQVTKFDDRAALKKYLLSRPDLYGDESEREPFVTINGEVI